MLSVAASASCGAKPRNDAGNGRLRSLRSILAYVPEVPNALSSALASDAVGGRW